MPDRLAVIRWLVFSLVLPASCLAAAEGKGDASEEPLQLRLVHPERQAERVLDLFRTSRVAHPAAALAAWKRAAAEPDRLGKPLEALIAFFNPEMVPEWGVLDGARLRMAIDPGSGAARWSLCIPKDDGLFASALTAMRLSGAEEAGAESGNGVMVRVGASKAIMVSRPGRGVAVACPPGELDHAWVDVSSPGLRFDMLPGPDATRSGLLFRIEPYRLATPANGSLEVRRLVELGKAVGCDRIEGAFGVRGDALTLEWATRSVPGSLLAAAIARSDGLDPRWLRWIPSRRAIFALSTVVGQGAEFWNALFDAADRVDRADPARAGMAPLRTRIHLPAVAVGARLEADLWPHLRGMTLVLLDDPGEPGALGGARLVLHLDGEPAARELREKVLPRLSRLWGTRREGVGPGDLGTVSGRPVRTQRSGADVLVSWGEPAIDEGHDAVERRGKADETTLSDLLAAHGRGRPHRMALFWPWRIRLPLKGLDAPSPLLESLEQGPPIVWTGWHEGERSIDRIVWPGLRESVRRFVDALPLAVEMPGPKTSRREGGTP
jgi:hypothetical protein